MDNKNDNEPQMIEARDSVLHEKEIIRADNELEHQLSLKDVFVRHPILVWWSFYWAMAGVGW